MDNTTSRKMLVESDPHQTRVAILEADRLTEIFIERRHEQGIVGNIYKGRVTRVLPGMQAAFVNVGLERDAFLYVSDASGAPPDVDDTVSTSLQDLDLSEPPADDTGLGRSGRPIEELLRPGQELIVQVTKDALPNKGARVTTHVTLPSRYLVLLPTVRHLGISRRIEGDQERQRLVGLLEQLQRGSEGLIVRTAGEGRGQGELASDLDYLDSLWLSIQRRAERVTAPTLIHQDLGLALRSVRDLFTADYSALLVEGEDTYQQIVEFLGQVQPALASKVKLASSDTTLFQKFEIEAAIEAALSSKVWLRSGGHLVINQTEALVAIDVNTGRYVGQENLEETVLLTNLEAVKEIVRQIRLRDLSGILIIDLIDMTKQEHRDQVFAALEAEIKNDRAKSKLTRISEFGLIEVTRKRSHANLERLLTRPCPYCQGRGRIKGVATLCLNLRREILKHARGRPVRDLVLRVHPDIARALQTEERAILEELRLELGSSVLVQGDREMHHEAFDLSDL